MFQASFLMPSFGNDTTDGTVVPYNTSGVVGMPLGHNCQTRYPYTSSSSAPAPYYCSPAMLHAGAPVTGSGQLVSGYASVGGAFRLPSKAFAVGDWLGGHATPSGGTSITPSTHMYGGFTTPIDSRNGTTGFLPRGYGGYPPRPPRPGRGYPYVQSHTYATFHNVAANFFAGGGPAASGTVYRRGKAKRLGSWYVTPGTNALGGAMGILGRLGAHRQYFVPRQPGTYEGLTSWNMVKAMERTWGTSQNRVDPMNPYTNTGTFYNWFDQVTSTLTKYGTGSPWTTGDVTVYGDAGYFTTILHRGGFDTTSISAMGAKVRNIQLVTPALTHWQGVLVNTHTGHIGILTLRIVPEPGTILLLAVGAGALVVLRRVSRRG